jgi:5-hydroxyisourate hydrolase
MKSISTHVLDTSLGRPAAGIPITLEKRQDDGQYNELSSGTTDEDGRIGELVPKGTLTVGTYRITFDTGSYFEAQNLEGFYPQASIVFIVRKAEQHYHVPLLLNPFGYSTYRGS